ncbi:MAG: UDP-N-acetylmuramoyl-tripeptide--D-alanyl-D-alanine ligase [Phycisphaerales bacterium]|nr:MAG: UDP-N-acetylmuramoyl-tripeptide--D-alanyl-D-alanine ligase [Phycisphaerales bacterium]
MWTAESIRSAIGGVFVARPKTAHPPPIAGFTVDSRAVGEGEAFFALRGERTDGHLFARQAALSGAALLIVEDASVAHDLPENVYAIKVGDTRLALLRLARAHRRMLEGTRVIAVTGSAGKTTTVRLIDAVLSTRLRGVASKKSFNNDVGVPLTVLRAVRTDQYLLCEVGTNAPGEIAALAEVLEPDVAVITGIGRAHLEGLGSLEGVAREKGSLLAYLRPGGCAIVGPHNGLLNDHLRAAPNVVTVGDNKDADLRISGVAHTTGDPVRLRFTINERTTYELPLIGAHNAVNAALAVGVARRMGVDEERIIEGLARAEAPPMRMQRATIAGVDVFNDAYNANPESVIAALRTFSALAAGAARRVAVLGDMLELGDHAPEAHREVAEAVLQDGTIDLVVAVGSLALHTAERLLRDLPEDRVRMIGDVRAEGARMVASCLRPGDAVLLKGSRVVGLERIARALEAREAGEAEAAIAAQSPSVPEPGHAG